MADLSLPLILSFAALALAWLLPGHYLPWTSFQQETVAAFSGLLLCLAAIQSRMRLRWPAIAWLALVLASVPWVQFALGQIRFLGDAVLPSAYLLALAMAIFLGASLTASRLGAQLVFGLTGSCIAAAILSGGIALHQWLQLPPVGDWLEPLPPWPGQRPFGHLNQPNHLASLLALGAAALLHWYETRRIGPWGCAFGLGWLAWGMAMTQSRTGWLFVIILAGGCLLLRHRAGLRTSRMATGAGMAVFAAMVLLQGPLHSLWFQSSSALAVRSEVGTRLVHWQTLGEAALQAPWFGYGWNQVAHAQYDFAAHHPATGEYLTHSHNLVLDLALYNGIPIATLVMLGMAAWLVRTLKACRNGGTWCLVSGLLALLTHAMLEYPLHYFYFLLPAGLLIGMLHVPAGTGAWSTREVPPATLWLPTLLMTALLGWVTVEYMRAEEALRRLRFASARIGITFADLRSPEVLLLDGWKGYHDAALLKVREGMQAPERAFLRDIARRYSYPPALFRYAQALALNAEPEQARNVLAHACKIHQPSVHEAMREMWREQQANSAPMRSVAFPDCAG